jgi:hypothetical protein
MCTAPHGYGRPFTRSDLERMPDDGRRYELVDGVLIVGAASGRVHQRAVLRLAMLLDAACPPEFEVSGESEYHAKSPYPVTVIPDMLVR